MCIAIYQGKNKVISKDTLKTCSDKNRDGCGLMYAQDGKLYTYKTLDFEDFYRVYDKRVKEDSSSNMVVHFRTGTGGKKNVDNCHPFVVNKDLGFVHNGVISKTPGDTEVSDTHNFNKDILRPLSTKMIMANPFVGDLISEFIGSWNKLIFLTSKGEYKIFGEKAGTWHDGCWYSNEQFKNYDYYNYNNRSNHNNFSGGRSVVNSYDLSHECSMCKNLVIRREMLQLDSVRFTKYICLDCLKTLSIPMNEMFENQDWALTFDEFKRIKDGNIKKEIEELTSIP